MASKWLEDQAAKSRAYVDQKYGSKSYGGSDYAPTAEQKAQAQRDYAAWQQRQQQINQARQQKAAAPLSLPTFQQFRAQQQQPRPVPMLPYDTTPKFPVFTAPRFTQTQPAAQQQETYTPPEEAKPLTAAPNNSAPLQTLTPTGPAARPSNPVQAPAQHKYDPTNPDDVAARLRNLSRLGIRGDEAVRRALGDDEIADIIIAQNNLDKETKNLTFGDALKDPMYAAGVLFENLDQDLTSVGRQFLDSETAQEIAARRAAYNEAIGPKRGGGNFSDSAAATINRGAANFNAGTAQTINWLFGAPLRLVGWDDNPLQQFSDTMTAVQRDAQAQYDREFADASKGAQFFGDVGSSAVEALPDLILLAMSGGTSLAGEGAGALTRGGTRLAGREAAAASMGRLAAAQQTARAVAADTARNPMFWTSFSRSAGSSYEYAKSQGADEYHASLYALLNATANASVEIGGGIQTMPGELRQGGSAAWVWFKSMIDEGKEEVVQGMIERGLQNLTYNAGNPFFSTTDQNAIINPVTSAKEFSMGAAVAGVLGGPSSLQQGVYNLQTGRQAAQNAAPDIKVTKDDAVTAPNARTETASTPDVRAETASTPNTVQKTQAEEVVQRLSNGENVSNSALNAVMRTPEFAAVYQQQTGEALPTGQTNAQLRATIRENMAQKSDPAVADTHSAENADNSDPWERILNEFLEEDNGQVSVDSAPNQDSDEGSITLVTKDGEEVISGPRPLERADAARAAVETERAAEMEHELRRGDEPQGVNIEENEQEDITPQPLVRGEESDPAIAAAVAAAQPDAETNGMTRAQRMDYFNRLLDSGVEHSEAYRRAFGSEKFETGIFSPENQTVAENNASPALTKLGVKISSPIAENTNRKSIVEGNRAARKADRKLKARIKALNPSRAEMEFAQGISNGTYSEADIPLSMDSKKVTELAGLYSAAENNTGFFVQQIRRNIKRGVREKLDGLFVSADGVQVPRIFSMNMNTPQRIIRKMFKGEAGEKINSYLFDPVLDNSAEKIRFMNRMLDRVREFKLSKSERVLVARVLEGRAAQKEFSLLDPDMQKRVDAVARSENPGVTRSEYNLQNDDDAFQLALRYKAWLNTQARLEGQDAAKINKAADAYAEAYNDFYDGINDFLVNHGYEPIGFIQGYTPHMQTDEAKTGLSGVLQRLGLDPEVGLLPTEIAGRTDTFRPGKQWNPYFLQRTTGDPDTDYDAVEGYESYVNYMANVIYHTDDIMKLRETGNYFRTRYAKDQVRDLIEEARDIANKTTEEKVRLLIRENKLAPGSVLTDEQADTQLEAYIDSLYQDAKDMKKFGEFVSWLDDYTNRLAGKQTKLDRSIESFTGRRFLNLGNKLTKIFGESTIVGNLSSALNQTAQIPMLIREVGNINTITAVKDIITGETRRGNWSTESDFLTGKRGVDYISEPSSYQKVMDFASIPFVAVDDVTSQLYVRAKYVQCIKQGMDHDAAMKAADKFAAEMVGSRIQGAKPMVFESKNVFVKVLTTFQLEVANNWAYISQDLPAQYQQYAKQNGTAKAAAKVAGDMMKYLISAWLMNWLADELYGGSPAPFDIIGTAFDSLGAGKGLTGNEYMLRAFDNLVEGLTGERKLGTDEMPEGFDGKAALDEFIYNAGRDLPYLNNALSVAGISDSRMPLPSVPINTLKDAANLLSADESTRERAKQNIGQDALKELKSWVPMGNQMYKTYTGARALMRGGSFSGSGDEERMQYQLPRNLLTGAKALMFGANSTKEAQDWFASGYDSLSVKETNAFKMLTGDGVDEQTAYTVVRQLHGVNAEDGKQANAEKRQIITNANLSDEQKRQLFVSTFGDSREDELQALADAGLTFEQSMQAYDEYLRLSGEEGNTASGNATDFAAWADRQGYTTDQAAAVKDAFKFWMNMPAEADRYESFTAEGLSTDDAQLVATTLSGLEPEPGRTYVTAIQNYNAIVSLNISDDAKGSAMRALMDDGIRQKFDLTQNIGVTPEQYVMCYQATLDLKEATGKSSVNQGMAKAAVDSIPGLTTEQRAVLWQIQNKSWKPSSNPYDTTVGAVVATILNDKPENNSLP